MENTGCYRREDYLLQMPVIILIVFTPCWEPDVGGVVVSLRG